MDANVDAVRQVTSDAEDRPTALYPLGGGYVAAGNTFVTSLIELSGAENVAARNHTQYPQLSNEVILQLDPDVLFVTENTATIAETEPYASTTAGETNSTVAVQVRNINQPPRGAWSRSHTTPPHSSIRTATTPTATFPGRL